MFYHIRNYYDVATHVHFLISVKHGTESALTWAIFNTYSKLASRCACAYVPAKLLSSLLYSNEIIKNTGIYVLIGYSTIVHIVI